MASVAVAGCSPSGSTPAASPPATVTVTAAPAAAVINAATFAALKRLNDEFVATVSGVPAVRDEIIGGRDESPRAMVELAHGLCMYALDEPVDGGPDAALLGAAAYADASMFLIGSPLSDDATHGFVGVAARTFCPDKPCRGRLSR